MIIRRAEWGDLHGLNRLLRQVLEIHHAGRPDVFKTGAKKYTDEELSAILRDEGTPVFVAVDEQNEVLGYAFCIFKREINHNVLTDVKTLYIDDLCVDERTRGKGVGRALYDHVVAFAKESGCYNLTLNVWACNESAKRFYERLGLIPRAYTMETILGKIN